MSISSRLLNKTGVVYRKTFGTPNTFGESAFTKTVQVASLVCTVQVYRDELTLALSGLNYVVKDIAYCNYRSDILPGDLLNVNSHEYLIISVEDDGGRGEHLKMFLART